MRRIFPSFAYSAAPRAGCWWDHTCDLPRFSELTEDHSCDVAIIGGGFTGVSAALHLASAGVKATVLEMNTLGWGASGRNGGFCCLGGSKASDARLDATHGRGARLEYRSAEAAAVHLVEKLLQTHQIDVDRHSNGETALAHRERDVAALARSVAGIQENYGVEPQLHSRSDLAQLGFGGPFFGGMSIPLGFGLNPRKYLGGLIRAASINGAVFFENTTAGKIERRAAGGYQITTAKGTVTAEQVIVATNGYSSETIPEWLAGRYMPTQSSVMVTPPLSDADLDAVGWTSMQMSYDTRNLVHYFRLMPDRRFLFGMRGGLLSSPGAEASAHRRLRRDFENMFPQWRHVPSDHRWSGLVCLARNLTPFVGPIPRQPGLWAGMCYHGNGVAMGTLSGAILAQLVQGKQPEHYPKVMQGQMKRFPFGAARRGLMPFVYAGLKIADL